jgi:hypothetical protein
LDLQYQLYYTYPNIIFRNFKYTTKIQTYLNYEKTGLNMDVNKLPEEYENKKLIGTTSSNYVIYGTERRVALYKLDNGPSNPMAVFPNDDIKENLEDTEKYHDIKQLSEYGKELVEKFEADVNTNSKSPQ